MNMNDESTTDEYGDPQILSNREQKTNWTVVQTALGFASNRPGFKVGVNRLPALSFPSHVIQLVNFCES